MGKLRRFTNATYYVYVYVNIYIYIHTTYDSSAQKTHVLVENHLRVHHASIQSNHIYRLVSFQHLKTTSLSNTKHPTNQRQVGATRATAFSKMLSPCIALMILILGRHHVESHEVWIGEKNEIHT